jgi:hypothetical protein
MGYGNEEPLIINVRGPFQIFFQSSGVGGISFLRYGINGVIYLGLFGSNIFGVSTKL